MIPPQKNKGDRPRLKKISGTNPAPKNRRGRQVEDRLRAVMSFLLDFGGEFW